MRRRIRKRQTPSRRRSGGQPAWARALYLCWGLSVTLGCVPRRELSSYLRDDAQDVGPGIAPGRAIEAGVAPAAPDATAFQDAAADAAPDASDIAPPGLTCRLECDCEPRGGETFMFCPEPVGRTLAVERCELAGGALVSIEDAALNAWLSAGMADRSADDFWTDGTDSEVEGVWRWSDGRIFYEFQSDAAQPQFTAWEEGQPNDLNGEDCMRATGGLWRDLGCDEEIAYVCES